MKIYEVILISLVAVVAIYAIGELIYWLYIKLYNRDEKVPTKADWEGWKKVERYLSLDYEEYYQRVVEASYKAIDVMRKQISDKEE